jgi:hypothetical protein
MTGTGALKSKIGIDGERILQRSDIFQRTVRGQDGLLLPHTIYSLLSIQSLSMKSPSIPSLPPPKWWLAKPGLSLTHEGWTPMVSFLRTPQTITDTRQWYLVISYSFNMCHIDQLPKPLYYQISPSSRWRQIPKWQPSREIIYMLIVVQ